MGRHATCSIMVTWRIQMYSCMGYKPAASSAASTGGFVFGGQGPGRGEGPPQGLGGDQSSRGEVKRRRVGSGCDRWWYCRSPNSARGRASTWSPTHWSGHATPNPRRPVIRWRCMGVLQRISRRIPSDFVSTLPPEFLSLSVTWHQNRRVPPPGWPVLDRILCHPRYWASRWRAQLGMGDVAVCRRLAPWRIVLGEVDWRPGRSRLKGRKNKKKTRIGYCRIYGLFLE